MEIGFAQQCITPALPAGLAGFSKKRIAELVRDDLYVKAVVFQKGGKWYGALAYDLIGVDGLLIRCMKDGMEKMQMNQENFLFTATHTHSGLGGVLKTAEGLLKPAEGIFLQTDPVMLEFIAEKSLLALKEAVTACEETSISCANSSLEHMGANRNRQDLKGNNGIAAVFLKQKGGKSAAIWHYACHPTVMGIQNKRISADFPGEAAARMEKHGYDMCMFVNGSCGDISTRFSRRGGQEEELLRYGHMLEEKLLEMEGKARPVEINGFEIVHKAFRLKIKQAESLKKAQEKLYSCQERLKEAKQKGVDGPILRVLESYKEGAESGLALAQNPYSATSYDVPVMFVKVNQHIFICVPGELFSELSNPFEDGMTHFIGYANGYAGYFADMPAYDSFYYEALSSPFQKGEGEKLMLCAAQEVKKISGKGGWICQ